MFAASVAYDKWVGRYLVSAICDDTQLPRVLLAVSAVDSVTDYWSMFSAPAENEVGQRHDSKLPGGCCGAGFQGSRKSQGPLAALTPWTTYLHAMPTTRSHRQPSSWDCANGERAVPDYSQVRSGTNMDWQTNMRWGRRPPQHVPLQAARPMRVPAHGLLSGGA